MVPKPCSQIWGSNAQVASHRGPCLGITLPIWEPWLFLCVPLCRPSCSLLACGAASGQLQGLEFLRRQEWAECPMLRETEKALPMGLCWRRWRVRLPKDLNASIIRKKKDSHPSHIFGPAIWRPAVMHQNWSPSMCQPYGVLIFNSWLVRLTFERNVLAKEKFEHGQSAWWWASLLLLPFLVLIIVFIGHVSTHHRYLLKNGEYHNDSI